MRCFGCLSSSCCVWMEHQGTKTCYWISFLLPRTNNAPPPNPNIPSCYLEPDPLYPTRSFSEQNPEWFKSASSRNHPRPSEASCLPNQAGFEASCFQHHRQEKRERIWPLYQFLFSLQGTICFGPYTRVCVCGCVCIHTPRTHFLLRVSIWTGFAPILFPAFLQQFLHQSAETKGSRLACPASMFKAGFGTK